MRLQRAIRILAAMQVIGAAAYAAEAGPPAALLNYADLVLFNGSVLTVNAQFDVAEAIAVRDGRVLAVGTSEEILQLAGADTARVDLDGRGPAQQHAVASGPDVDRLELDQ